SFYGLIADGYYTDSLDAAPYWAQGARPGRIKFKDLDGDGQITAADRTYIGRPHPDFTAGLDLAVRRGNWELSATVFGSFGNQIFNTQKYWYAFRYFQTNVAKDMLTNSAQLDGPCAPLPSPPLARTTDAIFGMNPVASTRACIQATGSLRSAFRPPSNARVFTERDEDDEPTHVAATAV